jgi:2-oxo-4-hydroxy-4-carboxy-5-ureidoimidazoline decarboxylase
MIDLPGPELRRRLAAALGVQRWVEDVAARAPFEDLEALRSVAYAAATPLTREEIDEAIADHPRIGERPTGASAELSRSEQGESTELAEELAAGNAAYESRFGRIFLIRAAGRSRSEILAELRRRLELDDATDLQVVGEQLRDIALLRLEKLFGAENL